MIGRLVRRPEGRFSNLPPGTDRSSVARPGIILAITSVGNRSGELPEAVWVLQPALEAHWPHSAKRTGFWSAQAQMRLSWLCRFASGCAPSGPAVPGRTVAKMRQTCARAKRSKNRHTVRNWTYAPGNCGCNCAHNGHERRSRVRTEPAASSARWRCACVSICSFSHRPGVRSMPASGVPLRSSVANGV